MLHLDGRAVLAEGAIRVWHRESEVWVDVTSSVDTVANTACGRVTSLPPFVLNDNAANFADPSRLKAMFYKAPGPSGLVVP